MSSDSSEPTNATRCSGIETPTNAAAQRGITRARHSAAPSRTVPTTWPTTNSVV
jgi:hypothetical protein